MRELNLGENLSRSMSHMKMSGSKHFNPILRGSTGIRYGQHGVTFAPHMDLWYNIQY